MTLPQGDPITVLNKQVSESVPKITPSQFLTKRQFAELLQVSERTIDRWLVLGVIPPECKFIVGGTARFERELIEKWIRNRTHAIE